ncbi:hypothetical protein [Micromonospora parathelypteridis]|uniref:ElaB/YqjD/DUF883 family membrane-anchored ribosome-binding protein n=1 Tax=Micromonospora parathelypteridis TaxID=1839617 RepID=A0A840VMK0_9ACTN|nr:hypothetical protein [Micromonospora parathelypteridis]MBB5477895.1 ElaB/YqjD/DUF883 family membrane-anchored ribosome-binding protein [Micromonospora parathelypteridis]GGO12182.1 hypothetical protein GCM10011576_21350 [Micromonospora parathelypteridis]
MTATNQRGQQARQEASRVGQQATQAGGQVAHTAAEQGGQVAAEARRQAQQLTGQASGQLRDQAQTQQRRAAEGLRDLGRDLGSMAERDGDSGLAGQAVRRVADAAQQAAGWLDEREPGEVLDEVRAYARSHPGTFLAGAAVAGLLVGRLTRGLTAPASGNGQSGSTSDAPPPAQGAPAQAAQQPYVGTARAQNVSPDGHRGRDLPGGVAP